MSVTDVPDLIYKIIGQVRSRPSERPALIGVGGAQGSGKSTACWMLEAANRERFAHFSLDDVYLTRAEREHLAESVHPLLQTRGVPGTHDIALANRTVESLEDPSRQQRVALPRFDKALDDRSLPESWPIFKGLPEAILVDGWCMGALPLEYAALAAPINALEAAEDVDGVWRRYSAAHLADEYATFFEGFDALIYLQAPSWEIVRAWRGQQEEQMLGRALTTDESTALDRFVMHYERVTRSMMAGRLSAKWIVHLDETRNVTRIEER